MNSKPSVRECSARSHPLHKPLKYFQNSIRPYVTYAFPTGIYNPQDIRELDSVLARFAKRALYLPLYTPNAMILEKVEHMGIGATSLRVDYLQIVTA
jgi:hypothetical protein